MSVQQELSRMIRPLVEDLGLEFVGLEYLSNPKNRLVRVYIDREPDGVTVDDCAEVSGEISARLDVEDPVSGHYSLEVSSPGIERPLFEVEHYRRFLGEVAQLELHAPVENRRRIRGVISTVSDEELSFTVDGQEIEVRLDNIRRGRLKPDLEALMSTDKQRAQDAGKQ